MRQELLAPAGSLETFYAVIAAGANAVYLGGPKFGARAYAKNFTEEECIEAIHYAHLKGVKVYMTVNTLVKNNEFTECINSLRPYYEAGLDGVIVQDLGVLYALGKTYPNMALHASTQMSVSNKWGALLLKKFGVNRVVPSRELSLEEIKRMKEEAEIEVETFIHGALCYSYSGQCLMSSLIGGRSGNRGRCAQPCRLSYELLDNKNRAISKTGTILSLKDLAMLQKLPDLAEIPVDSLKIEGRMKQTEYAYTVVSLYRKYLDQCESCDEIIDLKAKYEVLQNDWNRLLDSGNREGFTTGYYFQRNDEKMITKDSSAHNSQSNTFTLTKDITLPIKEWVEGKLTVAVGQPLILEINYKGDKYDFWGPIAEASLNKPTTKEQILKQLNKTGNSLFAFSKIDIIGDENVFLPVSVLNEFRRNTFEQLLHIVIKKYIRNDAYIWEDNKEPLRKFDGDNYLSVSGNIREQLNSILQTKDIKRIYLDFDAYHLPTEKQHLLQDIESIKRKNVQCYGAFPYVFRHSFEDELEKVWEEIEEAIDGFLVRSLDSLGYLIYKRENGMDLPIIADEMLYTYSDNAVNVFEKLGCEACTVPYELNKKELLHHNNFSSEMVIYGKIPVMITANCVKKTCHLCKKGMDGHRREILYLNDRKNAKFPVEVNCNNCGNIIYNSVPLYLMDHSISELHLKGMRIHITDETPEQIKNVFKLYKSNILNIKEDVIQLPEYTYGHYKRGVE